MEKSNFVQELSSKELENVNGGLGFLAGALLSGLLYDILSTPGDWINGFSDGAKSNF